ncbi:unnamed protein product [Lathyrus sativus]|nr:unnamed protein product [Lathyrus sativus]
MAKRGVSQSKKEVAVRQRTIERTIITHAVVELEEEIEDGIAQRQISEPTTQGESLIEDQGPEKETKKSPETEEKVNAKPWVEVISGN